MVLVAMFASLAFVTASFVIVNAAEPVTSPVCVALGAVLVIVIVPDVVIGDPEILMPVPPDAATEVTDPVPVPTPMAARKAAGSVT
jgi:hypothetical protein